jgi:hypothetical protein
VGPGGLELPTKRLSAVALRRRCLCKWPIEFQEMFRRFRVLRRCSAFRRTDSGRFALNREIPFCARLRGRAGRTRTSNQTIISRQLSALSTAARLAESPEWSETAVSAQEDRAQSCANGDFPVQCESLRTGGDLCTHFVSAICRLNCSDRFGAFVSAPLNRVSRRRRPALVETRFECCVSETESRHSAALIGIR